MRTPPPRSSSRHRHYALTATVALAASGAATSEAHADPLVVTGSTVYDSTTATGYLGDSVGNPLLRLGSGVNNLGTAVGNAQKYVSGTDMSLHAVRWDASGTATEMATLGMTKTGASFIEAFAINDAGIAVGSGHKYLVSGSYVGDRAVRWNASGTVATALGTLGTGSFSASKAYSVNVAGTAVGFSTKYDADGIRLGESAVRWDATGTAATELGNLGTDNQGFIDSQAIAINAAGTIVGYSAKGTAGNYVGTRAVRWDASSTVATELGVLGTVFNNGYSTTSQANAVNSAGLAVGFSEKYANGQNLGTRAVRWDPAGTVATELGTLSANPSSGASASATAVNDLGTAVGYSAKFVPGGSFRGNRAVRWDASGTAATELANLGTTNSGYSYSNAYAVNIAGTVAGYSNKYIAGTLAGARAVLWLPDASVVDLNNLGIVAKPADGTWTLSETDALSSDGWVAGKGTFTPTTGAAYSRLWSAQVGLGGRWTNAFTGSLNGTWGRGPQWTTGTPAMQVGNATFDANAAYTVTLDRDEHTQSIAVNAGQITLNFAGHTLATNTALTVAPGATLKGAGTILGDLTNAGRLAPGSSPGTMSVTGNLNSTGAIAFELAGTGSGQFDRLIVGGQATLGGSIEIVLQYTPTAGESFDLLDAGSLNDLGYTFDYSQAVLPGALTWDTSAFATSGILSVAVVPEPASLAMFTLGGLLLLRRRRR